MAIICISYATLVNFVAFAWGYIISVTIEEYFQQIIQMLASWWQVTISSAHTILEISIYAY